jgi:type I restriction enzyme S subunit
VYRQAVITDAYSMSGDAPYVRLDRISSIIGGITKGRDLSGIETIELPYLRVANVQNGYLDLSEIKTIQLRPDEKERYLFKYGDVLYTEGGDRDKLGRGTVWRDEIPDCVHQNHIFKARIDQKKAIPVYVAYWSMSMPARNYFYRKGKQSVNLASINKTVLSALSLPLPDIEVQQKIVNHIESRLSVCDSIEQIVDTVLQKAGAMRQSILKQAFEGKL